MQSFNKDPHILETYKTISYPRQNLEKNAHSGNIWKKIPDKILKQT